VNRRARIALFVVAGAGFAALLVWGTSGIPDWGHYRGRYGKILTKAPVKERQTTNAVTAIVFDYRGLDTMGEEFILFAAVTGVALLLRETREGMPEPRDELDSGPIRGVGIPLAAGIVVLAIWLISHGAVTPGGGFQGGVVMSAAFLLLWLAGSLRAYRSVTPTPAVDFVEGVGAGGYVVTGLAALLMGQAFLHNLLPYGLAGKLSSGGSIPVVNWATALAVTAAFVLLFSEFLEERSLVLEERRK
jgi:multicomponent Na+:H+ antiporter subunit B